jgi:hypothetical protein
MRRWSGSWSGGGALGRAHRTVHLVDGEAVHGDSGEVKWVMLRRVHNRRHSGGTEGDGEADDSNTISKILRTKKCSTWESSILFRPWQERNEARSRPWRHGHAKITENRPNFDFRNCTSKNWRFPPILWAGKPNGYLAKMFCLISSIIQISCFIVWYYVVLEINRKSIN